MNLNVYAVSRGANRYQEAVEEYSRRLKPFSATEISDFASESSLLEKLAKQHARTTPLLILLDSRGKSFTSEAFAAWLGRERDGGRQSIVFAIGPASGWSDEARAKADLLLSLGPMTLPHELARVVLMEQVYRAFTILSGHPYHSGH
jgi:23S rRNA (pseudouridine1915-N3)-methyltransferase